VSKWVGKMKLEQNISLKAFNTFGVDALAHSFVTISSIGQLEQVFSQLISPEIPFLVLGQGSNLLFTRDYNGVIIKNEIEGIDVVDENEEHVYVKAGAGVNWHEFVLHCINHDWGGVENLSLIPGTIGAAPVQNIGAYGVELKDILHSLRAWDVRKKKLIEFSNTDCAFGYRNSIFKQDLKGVVVIGEVIFKLTKKHTIKVGYGAIKDELAKKGISEPTIRDVSNAVIAIRSSKLPDPKLIGNAGSFFKNPVVTQHFFENLQKCYPDVVAYPSRNDVKLAAGWLIEQAGWKGFHEGSVGCYDKQALVLVNLGGATGKEILNLAQRIQASVKGKFDVELEMEVNTV
jgi:UDP-N-acetylmuramate dehydrogenase